MEVLLIIAIVALLGLSVSRTDDSKARSRYDPLPKPPASITRSYKDYIPKVTKDNKYKEHTTPRNTDRFSP